MTPFAHGENNGKDENIKTALENFMLKKVNRIACLLIASRVVGMK